MSHLNKLSNTLSAAIKKKLHIISYYKRLAGFKPNNTVMNMKWRFRKVLLYLYKIQGNCLLIFVNNGDLFNALFRATYLEIHINPLMPNVPY